VTTERVLITVRTYPTPSMTYRETVCAGGVNSAGEWRRLYPVMLRYLPREQQFRAWDVIEATLRPSRRDRRLETRRPHLPTLKRIDRLTGWPARCQWVQGTVVPSLQALVDEGRSIGAVAVQAVLDLEARKDESEWDPRRKARLEERSLFEEPLPLERIPYQFRLRWRDEDNAERLSLVISWEMAQTWRNYRHRYDDPIDRIKEKLLGDLFSPRNRVAFFMGNHSRFRDTYMVAGWFIPPREEADRERLF
jgi:hypothetical protein